MGMPQAFGTAPGAEKPTDAGSRLSLTDNSQAHQHPLRIGPLVGDLANRNRKAADEPRNGHDLVSLANAGFLIKIDNSWRSMALINGGVCTADASGMGPLVFASRRSILSTL